MPEVTISFSGDLAGLLRIKGNRAGVSVDRDTPETGVTVTVALGETASLKDVIESLGVPHCEVGAVTGDLTSLDALVTGRAAVRVEPVAPCPLANPRFLCDGHLGRLARLLRLLGFDTLWERGWSEAEIARRGTNTRRTVLSRSRGLLMRRELTRAMLVLPDEPVEQARQVVARFRLAGRVHLFGRCSVCNGTIRKVSKADVQDRIPPKTAAWLDDYYLCGGCGKLYWEGTHTGPLAALLASLLG